MFVFIAYRVCDIKKLIFPNYYFLLFFLTIFFLQFTEFGFFTDLHAVTERKSIFKLINRAIKDRGLPELYLLKTYLIMQQYFENKQEKTLEEAFSSCVQAYTKNKQYVPQLYLSSLMTKFTESELQQIMHTQSELPQICRIAHDILENRKLILLRSASQLQPDHAVGFDPLFENHFSPCTDNKLKSPSLTDSDDPENGVCGNEHYYRSKLFRKAHSKLDIPPLGLAAKHLILFLQETLFLPEDSLITSKSVLYLFCIFLHFFCIFLHFFAFFSHFFAFFLHFFAFFCFFFAFFSLFFAFFSHYLHFFRIFLHFFFFFFFFFFFAFFSHYLHFFCIICIFRIFFAFFTFFAFFFAFLL